MAKKQDELSIDFSKITGIFSKKQGKHSHKEKESKEEQDSSDEFSFDLRGIKDLVYKESTYKTLALILIPIIICILLRTPSYNLPQTNSWAESSVQSYYKTQLSQQIDQQYPNLPIENRKTMLDQELSNYISKNKAAYDSNVKDVSQTFKNQLQDDTGQTYLLAIDPYQWYRYGEDIIDHGYMGDKIVDGEMYDTHMLAPTGRKISPVLHPYLGAYVYKILNPITGMNLMAVFFLLPILLMMLAVIPAFFVGKRLSGNIGGFFSALIVAIHPAVLTRTTGGFSDTDPYTIMFPLFIFWLLIEAFETEDIRKKAVLGGLAGFLVGLFAFAWYGWWYIFDFAIGTLVIYLAYYIIKKYFVRKKALIQDLKSDKEAQNIIAILASFFIASALFVVLFTDFNNFISAAFSQPLSVITLKNAAKITLWPNVYTTVAEMNAASLSSIIDSMGGKLLFVIALAGMFLIPLKNLKDNRRIAYFILVAMWFFGALYATTKGIRFTVILTPAFAIGFGVAAGLLPDYIAGWAHKEMNIGKQLVSILVVIILIIMLVPTFKAAEATANNEVPSMNDAWNNALVKIKTNSSDDAIINSWWDFGHWFKAIADRAVTFDGASQNKPQAHWIGRTLLTSNEDEAVGILRMLDCGGNTAFDVLYNETNNTPAAVDILYSIILMNKDDAREELKKYVSEEKADEILKYTHCDPPEDFFITSGDMVGKAGVWAHFGLWDFNKAKIWKDYRKKNAQTAIAGIVNEFNYSQDKAEQIYYEVQAISNENEANSWISPWPGYITSAGCARTSNTTVQCNFNLQNQAIPIIIDTISQEAYIETSKGQVHPYSFVFIDDNGEFVEKKYSNNTLPYSIALSVKSDGIKGILMSPELASSMFTRLFYFDGTGLTHFDLFDYQRDITGIKIYTWKVDWEGRSPAQPLESSNPSPAIEVGEEASAGDNTSDIQDNSTMADAA